MKKLKGIFAIIFIVVFSISVLIATIPLYLLLALAILLKERNLQSAFVDTFIELDSVIGITYAFKELKDILRGKND